jgi:hypothetical protein
MYQNNKAQPSLYKQSASISLLLHNKKTAAFTPEGGHFAMNFKSYEDSDETSFVPPGSSWGPSGGTGLPTNIVRKQDAAPTPKVISEMGGNVPPVSYTSKISQEKLSMSSFYEGFEKQAASGGLLAAGLGAGIAGIAGLGALDGHVSDVGLKVDAARRGIKDKRETYIQKNPKLTGALSLGFAPLFSQLSTMKERDMDQKAVREVYKQHPLVLGRT